MLEITLQFRVRKERHRVLCIQRMLCILLYSYLSGNAPVTELVLL